MPLQRVRIVCISDTHNQTPHLPQGDILIHAGDLSQQGSPEELRKAIRWLETANFRLKIVVAGNHDTCLDPKSRGHACRDPSQAAEITHLLRTSSTIHYLEHESKLMRLHNQDGSEVKFKVFGSPYTPSRRTRTFSYAPEEASKKWDAIPLDTDIVVTHTPAKYHLDESATAGASGCAQLRQTIWRVRPKLFVCGHIHEGRGVQVVKWDLNSPNVKYKEDSVRQVPDSTGATKKQFCVDLSSISGQPLRNDGSQGNLVPFSSRAKQRGVEVAVDRAQRESMLATRGQGASSCDHCADQEALLGREGRVETCIVNPSYRPRVGRSFNKPVVVQMDFPVDGGIDEWYANALLSRLGDR